MLPCITVTVATAVVEQARGGLGENWGGTDGDLKDSWVL